MDHLRSILVRIEKAAVILNIEPWLLAKLSGFKMCWSSDLEARMDDGSLRQFRAVRIWHRSPHTDQPHKGGLRYHLLVNEDMMKAHAIEMSLKCWLMGIEWGGAKGGIVIDPLEHSPQELKNVTEALVDEMDERGVLGPFRDVPAPDMGTTPQIMNWIRQRYAQRRRSREDARFPGVVTGKPIGYGFGGIPGRHEATGYGLVEVLKYILRRQEAFIERPRLAIMGFGNVGFHVAKFASAAGFRVVAVSDVHCGIHNQNGINMNDLFRHFGTNNTIVGVSNTEAITNSELLALDVDVLVPAALEHVITKDNVGAVRAQVILEGANGPTTPEADEILQADNRLVIPDVLANAGGVTVSFFEWARNVNIRDERVPNAQRDTVLNAMSNMLTESAAQVWESSKKYRTSLRDAAYIMAVERVAPLFRAKHTA